MCCKQMLSIRSGSYTESGIGWGRYREREVGRGQRRGKGELVRGRRREKGERELGRGRRKGEREVGREGGIGKWRRR